jgi:carbon storage regulator CsrA
VLVLTRRPHEKIVLPGLDITIQVVSVKGGAIRLGIEAPPDVQVMREELLDQSRAPAMRGREASRQHCFA